MFAPVHTPLCAPWLIPKSKGRQAVPDPAGGTTGCVRREIGTLWLAPLGNHRLICAYVGATGFNMMSDDVIAEAVIHALSPCPGFNISTNPRAALADFRCDSLSTASCKFFNCPCVCHNV